MGIPWVTQVYTNFSPTLLVYDTKAMALVESTIPAPLVAQGTKNVWGPRPETTVGLPFVGFKITPLTIQIDNIKPQPLYKWKFGIGSFLMVPRLSRIKVKKTENYVCKGGKIY